MVSEQHRYASTKLQCENFKLPLGCKKRARCEPFLGRRERERPTGFAVIEPTRAKLSRPSFSLTARLLPGFCGEDLELRKTGGCLDGIRRNGGQHQFSPFFAEMYLAAKFEPEFGCHLVR